MNDTCAVPPSDALDTPPATPSPVTAGVEPPPSVAAQALAATAAPPQVAAAQPSAAQPAAPPAPPYTAVVHFHGIGQQRHYESVSQLVESLHDWVHDRFLSGDPFFVKTESKGLWQLKVKREPARTKGGKEQGPERVVYIQAEAPPQTYDKGNRRVRFYEAYWAPETVKGTTARAVLGWLLKQAWRPLQLLVSRWDRFDRVREADLAAMHAQLRTQGAAEAELESIERLAQSYSAFVDRRGDGAHGFDAFYGRLSERLKPYATRWHNTFRTRQVAHLAVIALLLAAGAAAVGLVLMAILWALQQLAAFPQIAEWMPAFAKKIQPTWENALALVPVVLAALGIRRFLSDHVGDVQQFVSYEETEMLYERRKRVLASAIRQLEHVLTDDACQRVVIVAHSLGTAVAYDALRDLAERNIAFDGQDPFKGPVKLAKIEHFVTLGSPIDKINYFFVTLQSKFRIYEVLARSLRGDIGSTPFSKVGRQPHIHWVNYWDRGDPISGSLESVTGTALGRHDVDNVRVVNNVVPQPMYCHADYTRNARVLGDLFGMIFYRRASFIAPARELVATDITDARALAAALRQPAADDLQRVVRERLSEATRAGIDALDAAAAVPAPLVRALVADLNELLHAPLLFTEQQLAGVALRGITRKLIAEANADHYVSVHRNRLLLEEVFPSISRAPRREWLGPGSGARAQSTLLWLQLVIPAALVLALLETVFDWGVLGRWTLIVALFALLGGARLERRRKAQWRRMLRKAGKPWRKARAQAQGT